ncbi:MAG: hypothetical protein HYZ37_07210 [Candidatus Solibacter usitatus]|nr:hypothetical protein [Candidatus Solibacter usitatus]
MAIFFVPLILLLGGACGCLAQKPPLIRHDFETGEQGWVGMGVNTKAQTSQDAHGGKASLVLNYQIAAKQPAMAVRPVSTSLAGMKRIRFWLKTDHATPVAVVMSETKPGGGDYTAIAWSPKNAWRLVDLAISDFALNDGPNDAKDEDGKLDPDKVQGLAVMDLSVFFASAELGMPVQLPKVTGEHTLWIDDFEVTAEGPPEDRGARVDTFESGTLQWMPIGVASLQIVDGAPTETRAMAVSYRRAAGQVLGFLRRINNIDLATSMGITVVAASEQNATVIMTLECRTPKGKQARYNYNLELAGNREPLHKRIRFLDFELDGNSAPPDAPSRVDPAFLRTLSFLDAQGMLSQSAGPNTIWIGPIVGYK